MILNCLLSKTKPKALNQKVFALCRDLENKWLP